VSGVTACFEPITTVFLLFQLGVNFFLLDLGEIYIRPNGTIVTSVRPMGLWNRLLI